MHNAKISQYLHWALKGILYLILFTPLLVSSKYLFPFITTKTIFFRLLIELAVLIYIALAMLAPKFRPKMNKLSWAVVIFLGIIFLTGLTGVNFYKTFWGTIERGEGFITLAHLVAYFLILSWTLKTKPEWLNYLSGMAITGMLVSGYAVLQRAQVEKFLWWNIIHSGEGRLSATIGNAAFLGAFTLAQFFLNLLLFLKRAKWWKILFGAGTLVSFYVLFETQTRGALLSWLLIFTLLSLFYGLRSSHKIKKYTGLGIAVLIILSSLFVWFSKNADWVQKNSTLRRLTGISMTDITTESRLLAWDTSWKGWKDRFILGYGWENYNIAYNKYFHAEIFKDAGSQLWFDRAHNTIFDVAVATGIFGLLNYLAIFGLALYYLFKNIKRDFDLSIICSALLIAHFIQNIFVFDVLATYIVLFTVLALCTTLKLNPAYDENTKTDFNVLIYIPLVCLIIFISYALNFKPLKANSVAVEALIAARMNQENSSINLFQQAIDLNTYQTPELRHKFGDNLITYNREKTKANLTAQNVYQNFKIGITESEKNIAEHPHDVQNHLYLMTLLNKAARYNPDYYNQVIAWGEKAIPLSPTRPQIYFEMGQARISQKRYDEGIAYFQTGVELNPETLESHWNLMAANILAGRFDKAQEIENHMRDKGFIFETVKELNRLYNVYLMAGQKQKLVEILEQVVLLETTAANYARLAAVYKEIGNYAQAIGAVEKAVELDPSLAEEAQIFIQSLNQ